MSPASEVISSAVPIQTERASSNHCGCIGKYIFRPITERIKKIFQRIKSFLFRTPQPKHQPLIRSEQSNSDRARSCGKSTQNNNKPELRQIIDDSLNTLTGSGIFIHEIENAVNSLTEIFCKKDFCSLICNLFTSRESRIKKLCASWIGKKYFHEEQLLNMRENLVKYLGHSCSSKQTEAQYVAEGSVNAIDHSLRKILEYKVRDLKYQVKNRIFHVMRTYQSEHVPQREEFNNLLSDINTCIDNIKTTLAKAPGVTNNVATMANEDFLLHQLAIACVQKECSGSWIIHELHFEEVHHNPMMHLLLPSLLLSAPENRNFAAGLGSAMWMHYALTPSEPRFRQVTHSKINRPDYRETFTQAFALSAAERNAFNIYHDIATEPNSIIQGTHSLIDTKHLKPRFGNYHAYRTNLAQSH